MLNAQQVADREKAIHCSELAAVLGIDKYTTRYKLWLYKTGKEKREDISNKEQIIWGHANEDAIAKEWSKRNETKIARKHETIIHKSMGYFRGHIDRRIVGQRAGLEIKNIGWRSGYDWGEQGTDEIPDAYLIQVQGYMALTGYSKWHVAALIGGNEYRQYVVNRNEEQIALIEEAAKQFWWMVENNCQPTLVSSDDCITAFRQSSGVSRQVLGGELALIEKLRSLKSDKDAIESEIERLSSQIKEAMGENEGLKDGDKFLCTWKNVSTNTVDTKKLREEMPEIADKYTRTTSTRKFLLK